MSIINTSIYIPRMSVDHTEESILFYMSMYQIGSVSHVDFTQINKKPGFGENVDQVVKSAFVHFRTFMRNTNFWETIANEQPYKLQVNPNEYWLCLKNKNPIQRTMMNIHQVVENSRHLEGLIEAQAIKIEELERKLEGTNSRHLEGLIEAQAIKIEELERKLEGTNGRHLERLIEAQVIKIGEKIRENI
jgi:hypothetical protein